MIDTPFQLLDSNSEETGLVCGIDGCSIEPSTQPLETPSPNRKKLKRTLNKNTKDKQKVETKSQNLFSNIVSNIAAFGYLEPIVFGV